MTFFTLEDLLEYYYHETLPEKSCAIAASLESNWELRQKFDVICQAAARLNKSVYSPRRQSIRAILNYAACSIDLYCSEN